MDEQAIIVRKAESVADYFACQDAQRKSWGIVDESYVVPIATMVGAQHHGGLVLGAFLPNGDAVGLSFGFLGSVEGRWCLYSQLTGVVPGYQGRGLGGRLKEFQRDYARSIGITTIAWAFDPLQAGNAYFNLHRLGASASRYLPNMYGPRTDALNAGVPTDRLIAEWPTMPTEPRPLPENDRFRRLLEAPDDEGSMFLVEIPSEIGRLRAEEPAQAERLRATMAERLLDAFATGHRAIDAVRDGGRTYYVLSR